MIRLHSDDSSPLKNRDRKETVSKELTARPQTGMDRAALSRLENGVSVNPTLNTLARFAQALGKRVEVRVVDAAAPPHRQPAPPKPTARKSVK